MRKLLLQIHRKINSNNNNNNDDSNKYFKKELLLFTLKVLALLQWKSGLGY